MKCPILYVNSSTIENLDSQQVNAQMCVFSSADKYERRYCPYEMRFCFPQYTPCLLCSWKL
jgi:hypothetical protein